MLSEEEVYNGAKNWLQAHGFAVIAGQPARGVDHLPVVEIKTGTGDKGSRESYKPDLLAVKDGVLYIIECKPRFDLGDYAKVLAVIEDENRIKNLYNELEQYSLLQRYKIGDRVRVRGMLAYAGAHDLLHHEVAHLVVESWRGEAELFA